MLHALSHLFICNTHKWIIIVLGLIIHFSCRSWSSVSGLPSCAWDHLSLAQLNALHIVVGVAIMIHGVIIDSFEIIMSVIVTVLIVNFSHRSWSSVCGLPSSVWDHACSPALGRSLLSHAGMSGNWQPGMLNHDFLLILESYLKKVNISFTWTFYRTVVLCIPVTPNSKMMVSSRYTALIWQKEASDKCDISCKRAKCVCHFHWRQWNIMMSYLTYLLAGWVFMHKIWPGRRVHWVKYENFNKSDLDGMSLASFCQSRAVYIAFFGLNVL